MFPYLVHELLQGGGRWLDGGDAKAINHQASDQARKVRLGVNSIPAGQHRCMQMTLFSSANDDCVGAAVLQAGNMFWLSKPWDLMLPLLHVVCFVEQTADTTST
jgi:hypothetical protein